MYDIEGKLRRRAMLERLTGLGRAAEATANTVAPPVPDQSPRPRHRNDPPADLPISSDVLARRLLSAGTADLDDPIEELPEAAAPVTQAVGIAGRPESAAGYDLVIPYQEASPYRDDDPYAEASPYLRSRPSVDVPAPGGADPLTRPSGLPGSVPAPHPGAPAADRLGRTAHHPGLEPLGQALPEQPSSATTIADLLRAGANKLFFDPDRSTGSPGPGSPEVG